MKLEERQFIKEFIEETMSKETQRSLISMCCESIQAFKSCIAKQGRHKELLQPIKKLMDIVAIESALTHHNLMWQTQSDGGMVRIAHQCAEVMILDLINEFDTELTLEQNLELWTLKKV